MPFFSERILHLCVDFHVMFCRNSTKKMKKFIHNILYNKKSLVPQNCHLSVPIFYLNFLKLIYEVSSHC